VTVSEATLEKARQWGREDAKDAIILAREAPGETDDGIAHIDDVLGPEFASDRAGKPARRLVSQWEQIEKQIEQWGEAQMINRSVPLPAWLPGGGKAWDAGVEEAKAAGEEDPGAGGEEALQGHADTFYADLDAADVVSLYTCHYPGPSIALIELNGEPIFSLYVVDRRRFSEFHREHWLGYGSGEDWALNEENVQKVYSEPKRSLRQRIFGSR
jgi:hypothetical protein